MIITVDTGGTKTLVASFDEEKNPKHIINNEHLEEMKVIKKRSIFDRLRKKGR